MKPIFYGVAIGLAGNGLLSAGIPFYSVIYFVLAASLASIVQNWN